MSTVTTYPIVVSDIPSLADSDDGLEELRNGLCSGFAFLALPELEAALREADNHPALLAFDKLQDEAIAEVTPAVAKLVEDAIKRRLPWTWPPASK